MSRSSEIAVASAIQEKKSKVASSEEKEVASLPLFSHESHDSAFENAEESLSIQRQQEIQRQREVDIFAILGLLHPNVKISQSAMSLLSSIIGTVSKKVTDIVLAPTKATGGDGDEGANIWVDETSMKDAVEQVLAGNLRENAILEASKAVTRFNSAFNLKKTKSCSAIDAIKMAEISFSLDSFISFADPVASIFAACTLEHLACELINICVSLAESTDADDHAVNYDECDADDDVDDWSTVDDAPRITPSLIKMAIEKEPDFLALFEAKMKELHFDDCDDSADFSLEVSEERFTSLLHACVHGVDVRKVAYFIDQGGVDINETNKEFGYTALHATIRHLPKNAKALVALLLDHGAMVDVTDIQGLSPLHLLACHAVEDCDIEIAEMLIEDGADIEKCIISEEDDSDNVDNDNFYDGCAPLHIACSMDNKELAKLLLSKGASIHKKRRGGVNLPYDMTKLQSTRDLIEWWPVTMAMIVLQDLMVLHHLDLSSVKDLREFTGTLADLKARAKREPSPYNAFMKIEIARVKQEYPQLDHKEAFQRAAKRWQYAPTNPNKLS